MNARRFGFDHLMASALEYIDPEDHASFLNRAEEFATRKSVKIKDVRDGDFVRIEWYLPNREAYVTGDCIVTKVDAAGIHLEPADYRVTQSFGDGATSQSLIRGMGPVSGKRLRNIVKSAWRFVPYDENNA